MKFAIMNGRLALDPMVTREGDKIFARFGLIVDDGYKKEGETENATSLFNMTANGSTAEFIEKYLRQGAKVLCTCEPRATEYTDKNGNPARGVNFHIIRVEFEETKAERERREQAKAAQNAANMPQGNMNIPAGMQGYAMQNMMQNPNMNMNFQTGQMMTAQTNGQMMAQNAGQTNGQMMAQNAGQAMEQNIAQTISATPVMPNAPVTPICPSSPVTVNSYPTDAGSATNNFVNMPTSYNDMPVGLPFN